MVLYVVMGVVSSWFSLPLSWRLITGQGVPMDFRLMALKSVSVRVFAWLPLVVWEMWGDRN